MANLKSSCVYGDLNITSSGKIQLEPHKDTWFQGLVDSPILHNTTENTGTNYCPCIFQTLTKYEDGYMTLGHNDIGFVLTTDSVFFPKDDEVIIIPGDGDVVEGDYGRFYFNTKSGSLGRDFKEAVIEEVEDGVFEEGDPERKSRPFIHSGNYTSYMPSKIGSGASGTWKISISGKAKGLSSTLGTNKGGTGKASQTNNLLFCTASSSTVLGGISSLTGSDSWMKATNTSTGWAQIEVHNKKNEVCLLAASSAGIYFDDGGVFSDGTVSWHSRGAKWLIAINSSGTVSANTSDRRKKFYIEDMPEDEVNAVLKVPIRNFIFKGDIGHNNLEQNGVFAQDLRNIMLKNNIGNRPYLQWEYNDNDRDDVYYDIDRPESDDMTYSVSYTNFIPALIKGWQMQNQKIEELEKKLAILRIKKENK